VCQNRIVNETQIPNINNKKETINMPKIMSGKQKKKIYKVELAKAQRELINASSRKKKKNIPEEQLLDLVFLAQED